MAAATITAVSPRKAVRGEAGTGTLITITGTNFEAAGGSVTIGGQAVITGTWSDTSITCYADDSPATPLGPQDIVVAPATNTAATAKKAVYIYDSTSEKDTAEKDTGDLSEVFIDGLHVGYCVGPVDIGQEMRILDSIPNDTGGIPVLTKILGKGGSLALTFRQINLANWALALVGTSTGTGDTGEIALSGATGTVADHNVMILDAGGRGYYLYRCQVVNPSGISLQPENWLDMPLTMRVLPLTSSGREIGRIVLP